MTKKRERRDGVWKDPQSGIWRYRFMHKGRRYFGTVPNAKNKTEAKAARDRRRIAVREGREEKAEAETNFKAFVKATFLPWIEMNKSASTYQTYKWRSDALIEAFGKLDLSEISTFAVEKFKREQLKRKTKRGGFPTPKTINNLLMVLESILTRAEELRLVSREDRPKIEKLPDPSGRIRYLTTEEEERLLAAAAAWPYLQDILVVGLATGLRRNELFSLKADDVDLNLNLVNVLGKGDKFRTVPLDPASKAYAALARLKRAANPWIFTTPRSKGKIAWLDKSLRSACKAAEVEGVTLHTLRHTFCTRLAASGVDVRTIQELAGHSRIETTMKYIHLVERNKHAAVRRLTEYQQFCHEFTTTNVVEIAGRRAQA